MDPFTIALATFGIQKLRGKSTKRSLRDAAIAGGIGQFAGMQGFGPFQAFGSGANQIPLTMQGLGQTTAGKGISALVGQKPMTAEQVGQMTTEEIAQAGGKEALMKDLVL